MAEEGRLRQRACVASSPGTRLNCCSQFRRPCASWMQASGHGQGCLPDKHREPFEWVAAVTPDSPLFAVALPAPSSPGKAPRKQGQFVCDGQHNKVVRPLVYCLLVAERSQSLNLFYVTWEQQGLPGRGRGN